MIDVLDKIINLAQESGWIIAYIAMNQKKMDELVELVKSCAGLDITPSALADYKGVKLSIKDIQGLQVTYLSVE